MNSTRTLQQSPRAPRVFVLGGGITGLTSAYYLLRAGIHVTVIEAQPQLGGLATYFDFGPFFWDKFYHCILTSDRPLLQLIQDLDLSRELRWTNTKVGFFTDRQLYSMSTTWEFLRFKPLSLWQKFRLGLGILYASRVRNGRRLEGIPVKEWLVRVFGRANYEKMWKPLLKCKLGACQDEASAAFIWATILRLYSTREESAGQKECLGYVRGGYRTVILRLIEEIHRMGGEIVTGTAVSKIERRPEGGLDVVTERGRMSFDRGIVTTPSRVLASLTPELAPDYAKRLLGVKYLGVVCATLVLKRKLSPFYVTNLTDEDLPFTGIIEMTNLISTEETQGRHLVYLPKYVPPANSLFEAGDEEIWASFWSGLRRVFPDIQEADVERYFIFRERLVQPVPVLHYSELVPEMQTAVPELLLANTTQIINSTLNNNEMVKIAKRAVQAVLADTGRTPLVVPQGEANAQSMQVAPHSRFVGDAV